ncbi:transcriptional regulator [Frankia sp. CcI49]|uniref:AfsR/SARP family transcriptional regulator n=1 Tax=unclassified Frankia TaxID=2632575 RepID=UPI0006CA0A0C|nr:MULTISPECIES: AfsR/SARP family transcriptional regulator [unclassified Frankia]KPM56368.1 transcriptional regulator [Frankia sp. R43]ONH50801.1 transcriptional regulator [Frankia sp. CcI49]
MKFKVLGRVEIANGTASTALARSKIGHMLSLLLAMNNETVSVDMLIDELWGEQVPRSAQATLQTYVYMARKMFTESLRVPNAQRLLVTQPPGYMLAADQDAIDSVVFERLVREGSESLERGDPESTVVTLTDALKMSRGCPFAGMPTGTALKAHVTYLQELRLTALGLRIDAREQLGRHRDIIPELRSLVAEHPLNEGFHAQLIKSLLRCGRRAEALQAYQRLWQILDAELGLQPTPEVQRLHHEVLG